MIITISDFQRITGVSKHTVYAWYYRNNFPEGIEPSEILGKTKILKVKKASKYFDIIRKDF